MDFFRTNLKQTVSIHRAQFEKLLFEEDSDVGPELADLFRDDRNPIEILKWKEVYDGLEEACDACKDFTHVLGSVVIKSS